MTRRDYVLIAAAINGQVQQYREEYQNERTRAALGALSELSLSLCDDLQAANAAFDRARFLAACGF